jgi:hypothetical protein
MNIISATKHESESPPRHATKCTKGVEYEFRPLARVFKLALCRRDIFDGYFFVRHKM